MATVGQMSVGLNPFITPTALGFTLFQVDASNDGVAMVAHAHNTNAITHLGFRYGARTGTPPTYRISLQGLDATTGFPDGTVLGGGSPASATFTPPADTSWDGTWQWVALGNSYTPTTGQVFAVVVEYSSGTVDASNRSSFAYVTSAITAGVVGQQYAVGLTAGTWSKVTNALPVFGIRTASERYGNIVVSSSNQTVNTQNHRICVKFRIPTDATNTYTVRHFICYASFQTAGKTPKLGIWNAAGTELQAITMDTDIFAIVNSTRAFDAIFDDSLSSLSAGTWYYIGFEGVDATPGTMGISGWNVDAAADRESFNFGANMMISTWNGSAWTDVDTAMPVAAIVLEDMTQQAGGGGGGGPLIGGRLVQ